MQAFVRWLTDGSRLIAIVILVAVLMAAWMFRYEQFGAGHRNRFTGAICSILEECWLKTW